jgi:DNA repair exonuclease SbcCD ATPase subunit
MTVRDLVEKHTTEYITRKIKIEDFETLKSRIIEQKALPEIIEKIEQALEAERDAEIKENTLQLQQEFLRSQIEHDTGSKPKLEHEKKRMETELPGLKDEHLRLKQSIESEQRQFDRLDRLTAEKDREVSSQASLISSKEGELRRLDRQIRTTQSRLDDLMRQRSEYSTQHPPVAHARPDANVHGGDGPHHPPRGNVHSATAVSVVHSALPDVHGLNQSIAQYESELRSLTSSRGALNGELSGLGLIHTGLRSEYSRLDSERTSSSQRLRNLGGRLKSNESTIHNYESRIPEIAAELAAIGLRNENRKNSEFSVNQLSPENQRKLTSKVRSKTDEINRDCESKKKRANKISYEVFIEELKASKLPENSNLLKIIAKIEEHQRYKEEQEKAQQNLNSAKTNLTRAEKKLETERQNYADNEYKISSLQGDIQKLWGNKPALEEAERRYRAKSKSLGRWFIGVAIVTGLALAGALAVTLSLTLPPLLIAAAFAPAAVMGLTAFGLMIASLVNKSKANTKVGQIAQGEQTVASKEQEIQRTHEANTLLSQTTIPGIVSKIDTLRDTSIPFQTSTLASKTRLVELSLQQAKDMPLIHVPTADLLGSGQTFFEKDDVVKRPPAFNPDYKPSAPPLDEVVDGKVFYPNLDETGPAPRDQSFH